MISKQDVDWNEIELLIQILSEKILKLSRIFSSITTLSRGGLVPARLLADSLGIKKIYVDKKIFQVIHYLLMIFLTLETLFIKLFQLLMIL